MKNTRYKKPHLIYYRLVQVAAWFLATFLFHRRIIRNELRGVKGPFVVIANHEAQYDFVNLIGMTHRRLNFVISNSFYRTLPVKKIMDKVGVIPKQQFQTTPRDLKRMKAVVNNGGGLVIYPAGLMCEDGLSTPIPPATYKFLKWLGVDVYMARTAGSYFVMPKWSKKLRPGKTTMDIYLLFSKYELERLSVDEVREKTENAILFDAYREQEKHRARYVGGNNIEGLENVLYMCPNCYSEFCMQVKDGNTLTCTQCGYALESDEYSLLHNRKGFGRELRYVSDWSKMIYQHLRRAVTEGRVTHLSAQSEIRMIDPATCRFSSVGEGTVTLSKDGFEIAGKINGVEKNLHIPINNVPSLPFAPGEYFEIQHGEDIYRCALTDGRLVMKYINLIKIFHEISQEK